MHGTAKLDDATCRQPFYIQGMFAWLHRRQPGWDGETAVLICSALNNNALASHHFLLGLADAFAAAGYPALRFDYPGTGDSCDLADFCDASGDHWLAWQKSVHMAADELLARTGAKRLVLCGLRIGATLAAIVAEQRADVSGLVLLAPVIRGKSYLRQLWVQSGLQHGQSAALPEGFTYQEFSFSADAVQSMSQADLRTVRMPAGRQIALFAESPSAPLAACAQAWTLQGAELWSTDFNGLETLLHHSLEDVETAPPDFTSLLDWAQRNIAPHPVFNPGPRTASCTQLRRLGLIETPARFGAAGDLFGMLCQPEGGETDIAVILCGGGRNPRSGVGRSGVQLARSLAAAGFASFRMDWAGIGDSLGPQGREGVMTGMFDDRLPDIKAAIDRLSALGYRRFAVQGLCSGAFHAFQAALADPRIGRLFLVNLPFFEQPDDAASKAAVYAATPWYHYIKRLLLTQSWRRMFNGEYDIAAILRGQARRLRDAARRVFSGARAGRMGARSAMAVLSARNVRILLLFGAGEIGFYAMERDFGRNGAALKKRKNVTLRVIKHLDHSLASSIAQAETAQIICAELRSWRSGLQK